MLFALGAGLAGFGLTRLIQLEEGAARRAMGCACHKKTRYFIDDDGNVTEFLAGRTPLVMDDETVPKEPCPVCRRGGF